MTVRPPSEPPLTQDVSRRDLRVLMAGSEPNAQGGMASVARGYLAVGWPPGVEVAYVPTLTSGSLLARGLLAVIGLARCASILARGRVDVVHLHMSVRGSFVRKSLLLLLSRACGVPAVVHVHGPRFDEFALGSPPPLRRFIRWTLEEARIVIALTPEWAERLRRVAPAAKLAVVANGVQIPPRPVDAPASQPLVLFLGRMGERKGSSDLVRAIANPSASHLNAVLAGDGELEATRAEARRLRVEDRVLVREWVDEEERDRLLRKATCLALPSYAEGLPITLLEAMAAGLPVVATPVGGIPHVVRHLETGILVPPGNVAALAEALGELVADGDLRKRLGTAARLEIQRNYTIETAMEELVVLWRSCVPGA